MDKSYEPAGIEPRWYDTWEQRGYFAPAAAGQPYCIVLPPPNVTGSLHMGHAFQQTLMDVLIRYHRMRGDNTLWQCGTDHAGIATQMVVERQLEQQGKTRVQLGRAAFEHAVWRWKETSGSTITRQSRRLGTSMDWTRERFTMDEGLSRAVQEIFIRLHEEGLIYRGNRLVNWDPVLHTAISDLEVVSEEESGSLWHIRYSYEDGSGYIVVATTRPETMLGDAAVAVHPNDDRYRHCIGKQIVLPLTGRKIRVIADEFVDPAFGSGCVKITPAHDFNDYAVGQRNKLAKFNIFTRDAKIVDDSARPMVREGLRHAKISIRDNVVDMASDIGIPKAYWGLDRFVARERIVADLEAKGFIEKVEPRKLMVPRGDRSGAVIEPYLTDQWYVRIAPLAAPAIAAVEDGRIRFVPENWSKTYFEWMRNIQDWCISRQLWWGHRIPAWYADDGTVYVGRSEQEIRTAHNLAPDLALRQDEDVLDTWFSSGLWPFSTLGWPDQTPELRAFYPGAVLVTGFDIIFFWVARMIMLGLKFMGDVPFREVYIHGLVRDGEGRKMSKSKGNILDPLDLIDGIDLDGLIRKRTAGLMRPQDAAKIEKATRKEFPEGISAYGTDALRMTFASLASPGRNINFDVGRIGGHRNFCNKLWNAARYVLMNVETSAAAPLDDMRFSAADHWVNSRLHHTIVAVTEGINSYRFDLAAQAIHRFTWDEYCDWYLELSKPVLTDKDADPALQRGTRFTLISVLETLLRLAHPLLPFISEEIWQRTAPLCGRAGPTIMRAPFPLATDVPVNMAAEREIEWLQAFILGVRRIRGEMNISPGKPLTVLVRGGNTNELGWLAGNRNYIRTLARLERIESAGTDAPESATALAGEMTLLIPLADLIDPRAEKDRLAKELFAREAEAGRIAAKLGNAQFVERAPKEVVEKERQRHDELQQMITTLRAQLTRLDTMLATRAP